MDKFKFFLLVTLSLLIASKSNSQNWIPAGSTKDGTKLYIKSTPVPKSDDLLVEDAIKVWVKFEEKESKTVIKGKEVKLYNTTKLLLQEYSCSLRQMKLITITQYNSAGEVVKSTKIEDYLQKWEDVIPDSVGEMMLEKVCELFN